MAQTIRTAVEQDLDAIAAVEAENKILWKSFLAPVGGRNTRSLCGRHGHGRGRPDRCNVRRCLAPQRKRCMADDLWGQHTAGIPAARPGWAIAGNGHCGGKTAGKKGPCAHRQGQTGALLRPIRFCQRGRFRVCARRRGMVSDAADVLNTNKMPRMRKIHASGVRFASICYDCMENYAMSRKIIKKAAQKCSKRIDG